MARKPSTAAAPPETPPAVLPAPPPILPPIPRRNIPFSVEIFNEVLELIADGQSLRAIARANLHLPTPGVFMGWLQQHSQLQEAYVKAREVQQHALADETVEIADTDPDPSRARNRIYARQWHAAKLAPKVYGDRTQMEMGGHVTYDAPGLAEVKQALEEIKDKL